MQYEWVLLPGISESSPRRMWRSLFHPEFRKALRKARPELLTVIETHSDWYGELRKLRDPGTHRIPLLAIPGWLMEDEATERKRVEAVALEVGRAGDVHRMTELMFQAARLGRYEPLMVIETTEATTQVNAWESIVRDHRAFQQLAAVLSGTLFP